MTMTVERVVHAPADEVFDWLADAGNYPSSRVVLRARLVTAGAGAPYGPGAVRALLWFMGWFRERITSYERPHRFGYVVEPGGWQPAELAETAGRVRTVCRHRGTRAGR